MDSIRSLFSLFTTVDGAMLFLLVWGAGLFILAFMMFVMLKDRAKGRPSMRHVPTRDQDLRLIDGRAWVLTGVVVAILLLAVLVR